jgi:hypothetical protein
LYTGDTVAASWAAGDVLSIAASSPPEVRRAFTGGGSCTSCGLDPQAHNMNHYGLIHKGAVEDSLTSILLVYLQENLTADDEASDIGGDFDTVWVMPVDNTFNPKDLQLPVQRWACVLPEITRPEDPG